MICQRTHGIPFQIYKVDSVRKDEQNDVGQFYKIYFCSPEMYYNQLSSVSKAYSGPIENAVLDILRQKKYLIQRNHFILRTRANAKYVIPSLKPYKAINYLSTQSLSGKYNNAGYLFYENITKDFHFRSLGSLLH